MDITEEGSRGQATSDSIFAKWPVGDRILAQAILDRAEYTGERWSAGDQADLLSRVFGRSPNE